MVPLLETARLRLRRFTPDDLEAHAAMLGDPDVARHLGGTNFGREEAWRRMLAAVGAWPMLGYGYWAVERLVDCAYIGLTGFADFKRRMEPSTEGQPEMGWIYASQAHGQGFALEAATAALQWADATLSGQEITAIIAPDNERSIRLARRLGFGAGEEARYGDERILLFRRPAGLPASTASATPSAT